MGLNVDLLAISATDLKGEGHHNNPMTELQDSFGLQLENIPKAVDLNGSLLNNWVSQPLKLHPVAINRVGRRNNSNFQRMAGVAFEL